MKVSLPKTHGYCSSRVFNNIADRYEVEIEIADILEPENKVSVTAMWDTGATKTTISGSVAKCLGIPKLYDVMAQTANGIAFGEAHFANIILSNGVEINDIEIMSMPDMITECLLGADIIAKGDFSISNFGGRTIVSFRMPSRADTDYVQNSVNTNPYVKGKKTARNDLCPCGSGKKFKNCCG